MAQVTLTLIDAAGKSGDTQRGSRINMFALCRSGTLSKALGRPRRRGTYLTQEGTDHQLDADGRSYKLASDGRVMELGV